MLRPGGRFAVSEVIADPDMDAATRADMQQWTGCIAGALTRGEFEAALDAAGLVEIAITETHRVHPHSGSAIIRARKRWRLAAPPWRDRFAGVSDRKEERDVGTGSGVRGH